MTLRLHRRAVPAVVVVLALAAAPLGAQAAGDAMHHAMMHHPTRCHRHAMMHRRGRAPKCHRHAMMHRK